MQLASTSLTLASLGWCARSFEPETTTDDLIRHLSVIDTDALAPFSQLALREAGQELLEAIADVDDEEADEWLSCIGHTLPDQPAMARLDALLGGTPEEWRSLLDAEDADERGIIVAARLIVWLRQYAPESMEPPSFEHLLAFGWPAPGCKEARVSFYRAYCLSLHDLVRDVMDELEPVLLGARLESQEWFNWLGMEAGLPPSELPSSEFSRRKRRFPTPMVVAIAAAVIGIVWWLISKPHQKQARVTEPNKPTQPSAAVTSPTPAPAPVVTLSGTPSPGIPSESLAPPPDTVTRARLLLTKAKQELDRGFPEAADVDAQIAQELLEGLLPTHDIKVGDALKELADYWESRERWTDATRLLQRAVQSYEGTPSENAGPQLDAVNRWAGALRKTGRLTEAEKLYRTLLLAYEGTGPSMEVDEATVAHNLANALVDKGRFSEARGLYERALSLLANHWQTEDEAQRLAGIMGLNYQHCLVALGFPEKEALAKSRRLLKLASPSGAR
jgi:hypothetical protein